MAVFKTPPNQVNALLQASSEKENCLGAGYCPPRSEWLGLECRVPRRQVGPAANKKAGSSPPLNDL
jgi:hypothetical protein